MKLNKFFMSLLGALALTACSSDDVAPETPVIETDESRFMAVTIRNAQNNGSGRSTVAEDFENGENFENNVTSLCFYFFKKNGIPFNVTNSGNRITVDNENDITSTGSENFNVEKILNAVLVLNAATSGDFNELNSMVAITNYDLVDDLKETMSFDDLKKIAEDYADWESAKSYDDSEKDKRFVMTSSVFGDGEFECEQQITMANLKTTRDLALENPIDVYVERTVAKIRVSTDWDASMDVETTKWSGKDCPLITLKDKDGKNILVEDEQIYVILTGWNPTNVADKTRLIKSVKTEWEIFTDWCEPTRIRSYWALNAAGYELKYFRDNQANGTIGIGNKGTWFYVNENAADNEDGTKSSYIPKQHLSNRTQVYISGILVTKNGDNYSPVELAKWGGRDFSIEGVTIEMLNAVSGQIYYCTSAESSDTHSEAAYTTIDQDFVKLVEGIYVTEKAFNDRQEGQRYLSYIQLVDRLPAKAIDGKLYTRNANYDEANAESKKFIELSIADANTILAGMPGARVWGDGNTYYYHDITHLGTEPTKGLYGVVRNHIYDIKLNKLTGLGTPILKPDSDSEEDDDIIPEKPTPDEFYLATRVNILSWRLVNNEVNLEW